MAEIEPIAPVAARRFGVLRNQGSIRGETVNADGSGELEDYA